MRRLSANFILLVIVINLCHGRDRDYQFKLEGVAKGGKLTFSKVPPKQWSTVISTNPGEKAGEIVDNIFRQNKAKFAPSAKKTGNLISGLGNYPNCGIFVLGGDDPGFRMPTSPKSLSISYDFKADKIHVMWENSNSDYTSVAVVPQGKHSGKLAGSTTSRTYSNVSRYSYIYDLNNFCVSLVGYSGVTPSNAAVMLMKGNRQTEMNVLPFSRGVAPNWDKWGKISPQVVFAEGSQSPSPKSNNTRYQLIKFKSELKENLNGGLQRKFLRVKEGDTYRMGIACRIDSKRLVGNWNCELLIVPFNTKGTLAVPTEKELNQNAVTKLFSYSEKTNLSGKWDSHVTEKFKVPSEVDSLLILFRLVGVAKGELTAAIDNLWLESIPE